MRVPACGCADVIKSLTQDWSTRRGEARHRCKGAAVGGARLVCRPGRAAVHRWRCRAMAEGAGGCRAGGAAGRRGDRQNESVMVGDALRRVLRTAEGGAGGVSSRAGAYYGQSRDGSSQKDAGTLPRTHGGDCITRGSYARSRGSIHAAGGACRCPCQRGGDRA